MGGLKFKFIHDIIWDDEQWESSRLDHRAELLKVTRNEIVSRPSLQISSSVVTDELKIRPHVSIQTV